MSGCRFVSRFTLFLFCFELWVHFNEMELLPETIITSNALMQHQHSSVLRHSCKKQLFALCSPFRLLLFCVLYLSSFSAPIFSRLQWCFCARVLKKFQHSHFNLYRSRWKLFSNYISSFAFSFVLFCFILHVFSASCFKAFSLNFRPPFWPSCEITNGLVWRFRIRFPSSLFHSHLRPSAGTGLFSHFPFRVQASSKHNRMKSSYFTSSSELIAVEEANI